ncbi:MAG TPA: menaquinone biosynthesis protein [Acidobacteriota bacterium]
MRLRLSFIHFLNAFPLQWGFMQKIFPDAFEISFDTPAVCADRLASGRADVGLIPAIEYQRIDGLRVVPHAAIASRQEVDSVLFVSKKPFPEVKTVALDTGSRTSATLIRILLRRKFKISPRYHSAHGDLELMLSENDAALIIGNPALLVPRGRYFVFDLVRQWVELTGKPFVFAFWAVRQGVEMEAYVRYFLESKDYGLRHLNEIVSYSTARIPLSTAVVRDYLENKLNYDLDPENMEGLNLFYQMAHEDGLIGRNEKLRLVESPMKTADSG